MNVNEKVFRYNIALNNSFADIAYKLSDDNPVCQGYHCHEGCEIMQIWSDGGYVLVDDKLYPMSAGNIYIVNALESHCTNPDTDKPYIRNKITFSLYRLRAILEEMNQLYLLDPFLNNREGFSHMLIPDKKTKEAVDELFKKIDFEINARETAYVAGIYSYIIEMLVIVYRCYENDDSSLKSYIQKPNQHIQNTINYINNHLTDSLTIDDICANLHLSKYYLCHMFKKMTGITLMHYISQRRISLSKKLLISNDNPISEITFDCGFKSFSHFSRTFCSLTGFTPLEYRKRYRQIMKPSC